MEEQTSGQDQQAQGSVGDVHMTDDSLSSRDVAEPKRAKNSPKHTQATWDRVRLDYEMGRFKSCRELANRYKINEKTLNTRILRGKWDSNREAVLAKAEKRIEDKAVRTVDLASDYLSSSFLRAKKYERMLDASADNLGAKLPDGTPLVDPDMLDVLTRSEARIHELAKSALRIAPISQVDITSKGESLGSSFAAAMEKLRAGPALTEEQVAKVLEDRESRDKMQE